MLPSSPISVLEDGKDEYENACIKAKAYFDKLKTPCFALDTGLYFDGVTDIEQPRQNVQGIAGVNENDDDETRYNKMITWYSNLSTKYGAKLDGFWLDVYVLFDGENYYTKKCERKLQLTPNISQKDVHLPVASLYKINNKHYHDLTDEEKHLYMKPSMDCLSSLLTEFMQNQKPQFVIESAGESLYFDSIIISSGASAKYIGVEGEEKYIGKGYHSCATCDGFFYRKKEIIVVGGGDSAMEEANFLTKFATKVHLMHRSDKFRSSKIMLDRVKNNPKIEIHTFKQIVSFAGAEKIESVTIQDTKTKECQEMKIDGVFVAIGHIPNTNFVEKILAVTENGYLNKTKQITKYKSMSEIKGIFVAGDVEDQVYRQAITAAGEGCKAAIDCERWLEEI